jgi:predicted kinase
MVTLHITRGLPGCGKTAYARQWVAAGREYRARVNRDDLRLMLDDGHFVKGVTEPRILAARDAAISSLLRKGLDVISDDTNLPQRTARDLARLATHAGAGFEVIDMTDVPLATCLERNAARSDKDPVPEGAIRDMHARFLAGRAYPLPVPGEPGGGADGMALYEPKPGAPKAVIADIDGTTALMCARSPFDETRVHQDRPNPPVIAVIRAMAEAGSAVVFVSGRTDGCRQATFDWLCEHTGIPFQGLFMRAAGDCRKDAVVKLELFDRHVRDCYDVTCVLDDRQQVVDMWRSLGLTCLQVAPGDF